MSTEDSLKKDFWLKIGNKSWVRKLVYFSIIYTLASPLIETFGGVYKVGSEINEYFSNDVISPKTSAEITSAYWAGKDILRPRSLYDYEYNYSDTAYLQSYRERVTHLGCKAEDINYGELKKLNILDRLERINSYRSYVEGCIKNKNLGLFHLYSLGEDVFILEQYLYKQPSEKFYNGPLDFQIDKMNREWSRLSKANGWAFLSEELIKKPKNKAPHEYKAAYDAARKLLKSELNLVM
ncbi:hypothetical protein Ga0123461_0695 [Mariprofundus aestuarium]|uniref:Uncharacterized protein n=1 Tax=Mariprofundus aestuarium TaxID=1921086 RepID=A0A2K8KZZ6_MARES|nr:hypothetical protein [Mariprofundus aestuarium]ATX79121.1 hypothetical protein Ga0123461_0695 [Mariprofundus aestuarium]